MKLVDGLVAIEQIQPTKVLSKLRLDTDLHEVVLEQDPIVFTHKSTTQRYKTLTTQYAVNK